jgi:YihY family inner membrane protein
VSTATAVPETWELTGDDARTTLAHVGRGRLLRDAFLRLRFADGFSHARSMAFVTTLVLVQGVIAVVGLAAVLGNRSVADFTVRGIRSAVPGPASRVLTDAVSQAAHTGASDRWLPVVLGTVGALVTSVTLLGQLERALNRLYGVEQDRPTVAKYTRALVLTLTAGAAAAVSFVLFAFGRSISRELGGTARTAWGVLRWPIAIGLAIVAFGLLFRWAPRRHQPAWSWLAYGSTISVVAWSTVTLLFGLFFRWTSTFGQTYGPLAGIVALQLWALLSSIAILYGAAVAAQLEAVRAGVRPVQSDDEDSVRADGTTGGPSLAPIRS